jgi:hypothetical protein
MHSKFDEGSIMKSAILGMAAVLIAGLASASAFASNNDGRYDEYVGRQTQNSNKPRQDQGGAAYNDAFQSGQQDAKRRARNEGGAMRDEINEPRKAEKYYDRQASPAHSPAATSTCKGCALPAR